MTEFKQYVIDSNLQEITELIWPSFNKMDSNTTKLFDIQKFGLSIDKLNINELKVTKIIEDKKNNARYSGLNEIFAGNNISLPHEISHFIYRSNHKPEERDSYCLTKHIIRVCKDANIAQNINDFYNRDSISNNDKLIAYLYLADDNELTAKLSGLYVGSKLDNNEIKENDYYKKLKPIYIEMKEFTCSQKEIDEIIEADKVNGLISTHLRTNDFINPLNSNAIHTLIKEINEQGAKFVSIYESLIDN